jgi:hypothetical protein
MREASRMLARKANGVVEIRRSGSGIDGETAAGKLAAR